MAEESRKERENPAIGKSTGSTQPPSAPSAGSFTALYEQLRGLAAACLRQERAGHTLQPTALVHEAWLKLADQTKAEFADRGHYLAVAAMAMRRVLVDHARGKNRVKRGGGAERFMVDSMLLSPDASGGAASTEVDVIALDAALERLAALDERQARIVELRFFADMTVPEVAKAIGVSVGTVETDWRMARAWLHRELNK